MRTMFVFSRSCIGLRRLFAEAKERHGLRRHRLRGLANANIQGLLIAAGQNLKRLLWALLGRRGFDGGTSFMRPPSAQ